MIKDISKIMTWHVWKVTYLRRNVTTVCGTSYHLLGSQISRDSKIQFWLQVESYISDWRFSKSWHLARYVSRHNAMAYDSGDHFRFSSFGDTIWYFGLKPSLRILLKWCPCVYLSDQPFEICLLNSHILSKSRVDGRVVPPPHCIWSKHKGATISYHTWAQHK